MADFKEGQGIKTHNDNDVTILLCDGQSGAAATDCLSIVGEGDAIVANTNDWGIPAMHRDPSGNYIIPSTNASGESIVELAHVACVSSYKNHSAVAATSGTDDHDKIVTSTKLVDRVHVALSSPGCFKFEVGEFDGVTTFDVRAVFFTQPASPSFCCEVCIPEITGDGSIALRVRASNKDDTDNDAYSTMSFVERAA